MTQTIEEVMGLPSGWLLAKAGYLKLPASFQEILALLPEVSEDTKRMLMALYDQGRQTYRSRVGVAPTTAATPAPYSSQRRIS